MFKYDKLFYIAAYFSCIAVGSYLNVDSIVALSAAALVGAYIAHPKKSVSVSDDPDK